MRYFAYFSLIIYIFTAALSITGYVTNSALSADSLDGKSFSIKIKEHGKDSQATDDEIIFKDGTFFSTDCEQYGFSPANYESKSKGDVTLFKSTLKSDKEGKAEWEGKVKGGNIGGTFIWSKEGQDPIVYTYEGSQKQ
jgi:hypothetical protein